ncbi:MAG: peptide chain release factor 1 [Chitinophagales bacterium]|nr:MAG: peptide chain release factor 1 [Chitinophagales bacterium]
MLEKLRLIRERWEDIGKQMTDPEVVADVARFSRLSKEYRELEKMVQAYDQYQNILSNITSSKKLLETEKDEEFRQLIKSELDKLVAQKEHLEEHLRLLLIPKDPEDDNNAILEIRAGTGGDEASIFAGDLFRMYARYIDSKGWTLHVVSESPGTKGGFKEIIAEVTGEGAYGLLKYESGVHRVQRVPETEAQGRVHTSAASVAVLPEPDEVQVQIHERDIKRDTFRSSGAGGQHVNKTESAVRLTHIPTGIVVECQQERSQHKNYELAMKWLRSRIYEMKVKQHQEEIARQRKTMVSTGDRSAKIRTYNFPQSRVTDHRIGLTLYNLPAIMDGDLDKLIAALQMAENAEKLKAGVK